MADCHWTISSRVREYEVFLVQNGVGIIIPSFELMRTARDWAKSGRSPIYRAPSRELDGPVRTRSRLYKSFKYLVASELS